MGGGLVGGGGGSSKILAILGLWKNIRVELKIDLFTSFVLRLRWLIKILPYIYKSAPIFRSMT